MIEVMWKTRGATTLQTWTPVDASVLSDHIIKYKRICVHKCILNIKKKLFFIIG